MTIIPVPRQRRKPDFTLTMINIVFLLLLFFLTTGSLVNRNEAQSEIPVTRDLPLERLPRPLLLITGDGGLFLDGQPVTREDVTDAAHRALQDAGQADGPLNVLAQRDMPASQFLDIAQILRRAGLSLQIVTLRQNPQAAAR